jgi:hypothetical protein
VTGRCRHGESQPYGVVTQVVRLKRYGRQRLVLVHEQEDVGDTPRFLWTEARPWESARVLETWSDRWASEIFHEFGTQVTGVEAAQGRQEEAVTRHCRLRCVAPSRLQRAPAIGSTAERVACAQGESPVGQQVRAMAREAFQGLLQLVEHLCAHGQSCEPILDRVMPG